MALIALRLRTDRIPEWPRKSAMSAPAEQIDSVAPTSAGMRSQQWAASPVIAGVGLVGSLVGSAVMLLGEQRTGAGAGRGCRLSGAVSAQGTMRRSRGGNASLHIQAARKPQRSIRGSTITARPLVRRGQNQGAHLGLDPKNNRFGCVGRLSGKAGHQRDRPISVAATCALSDAAKKAYGQEVAATERDRASCSTPEAGSGAGSRHDRRGRATSRSDALTVGTTFANMQNKGVFKKIGLAAAVSSAIRQSTGSPAGRHF